MKKNILIYLIILFSTFFTACDNFENLIFEINGKYATYYHSERVVEYNDVFYSQQYDGNIYILDNSDFCIAFINVERIEKLSKHIDFVFINSNQELFNLIKTDFKSMNHINRNQYNKEAKGVLSKVRKRIYKDENGCLWTLQTQTKNKFHNYNAFGREDFDVVRNVKFLRSYEATGDGEYETIRKLTEKEYDEYLNNNENHFKIDKFSGENIRTGINQQTYNFSRHFFGHTIKDFMPHLSYKYYTEFAVQYGTATQTEKNY